MQKSKELIKSAIIQAFEFNIIVILKKYASALILINNIKNNTNKQYNILCHNILETN